MWTTIRQNYIWFIENVIVFFYLFRQIQIVMAPWVLIVSMDRSNVKLTLIMLVQLNQLTRKYCWIWSHVWLLIIIILKKQWFLVQRSTVSTMKQYKSVMIARTAMNYLNYVGVWVLLFIWIKSFFWRSCHHSEIRCQPHFAFCLADGEATGALRPRVFLIIIWTNYL